MARFRVSKRANAHLIDIYVYGAEQFGEDRAIAYQESLDACFDMIAPHPKIGRTSPTLRPGIRRHEHGSHVILYREDEEGVLIVAVLHGRRVRGLKL